MTGRRIQIIMQFADGSVETTWIDAEEGAFHFKVTRDCSPIVALAVKAPGSKVEFMMPTYALDRI